MANHPPLSILNADPDGNRSSDGFRGKTIGMPLSLLILPLLFLAAAGSVPVVLVMGLRQRWRERRFLADMRTVGRTIEWATFEHRVRNGNGTAIAERLGVKGPTRIWWTDDDVSARCPYVCNEEWFPDYGDEYVPGARWCSSHYTNPDDGTAKLVVLNQQNWESLETLWEGMRRVTICTHPKDLGNA